jgi:DNA ligase-1
LDGFRAYWDGSKFYSKQGKEIVAPSTFINDIPKVPLDGELWIGRNSLQHLASAIGKNDWTNIKYFLFDLPKSEDTYDIRLEKLKQLPLPTHVQVLDAKVCNGTQHLMQQLEDITAVCGEGLVARNPMTPYIGGRNNNLIKIKVTISSTI